jgi:hypothetical protein
MVDNLEFREAIMDQRQELIPPLLNNELNNILQNKPLDADRAMSFVRLGANYQLVNSQGLSLLALMLIEKSSINLIQELMTLDEKIRQTQKNSQHLRAIDIAYLQIRDHQPSNIDGLLTSVQYGADHLKLSQLQNRPNANKPNPMPSAPPQPATMVLSPPVVQTPISQVIAYLQSYQNPLPLTLSTSLYAEKIAKCNVQTFLVDVLTNRMNLSQIRQYGSYYLMATQHRKTRNNQSQLFLSINGMHEPHREHLFREALRPGSLLNTFFSQNQTFGPSGYLNKIQIELNKIETARNILQHISDGNLTPQVLTSLAKSKNNKEILLEYIKRRPTAEEKDNLVRNALNTNTTLHQFFAVKRGFFATSIKAGTLRELDRMNPDAPKVN